MSRLDRYVTAELVPPLLSGTLLFTAVLSFGYFFISSQWLTGVSFSLIGRWIAYQLPDTLVKVFPMAVVLMTVVAFGRMSTERELVAVQSGGISLGRLARPAAVLALLITALAIWLSLWVAPKANIETRGLYWDALTGAGLSQLVGKTVDLGSGLTLNMQGYDASTRQLKTVRLERWQKQYPKRTTLIFADYGTFEDNKLSLFGYSIYTVNYEAAAKLPNLFTQQFTQQLTQQFTQQPLEVSAAIQAVFPRILVASDDKKAFEMDTGLSRKQTLATYADAIGADGEDWNTLSAKLKDPKTPAPERAAARINLNRKLALPFGNLVLVLASLPFALQFGRTLGVSLGIALLIAVAYYLVFFVGLTFAGKMPSSPELGVWLANIVFAVAGLWLLRRV